MFQPGRCQFSFSLSAAASASLPTGTRTFGAELPPETTPVRLLAATAICFAPVYAIEAFLRAEGFTDIQHVSAAGGFSVAERVGRGEIDVGVSLAGTIVDHLDAGLSITALEGLHVGCYELFARAPIRSISDLKGRRLGLQTVASSAPVYLGVMATNIGLDPQRDIEWVTSPEGDAMERFIAGPTSFLGLAPEPQEVRTRGYRRVILNTVLDLSGIGGFRCRPSNRVVSF